MRPSDFHVDETLRDGTAVTFRAATPADAPRYVKAFARLESSSVYTRFFGYKRELSPAELANLQAQDFTREAIIVATLREGAEEVIIASGHYVAAGEGAAEVAFVVEEDYQGRGLARRLLSHLAAIGRANGLTEFEAYVLPENRPMLAVFERCGFALTRSREEGVLHVRLALGQPRPGAGP